jgi:uncharacterized membrane protein YccC
MGWWSLASAVVACCTGSVMASPNSNANFICGCGCGCGCGSFVFLIINGFYVALEKN